MSILRTCLAVITATAVGHAAELTRTTLGDGGIELSWPVDGALRVPCRVIEGEPVPITEAVTTVDGNHRVRIASDADEPFELRIRGADLPLVTYEAEDGVVEGEVVRMADEPDWGRYTPVQEASARGYAELRSPGHGVGVTALRDADGIFVRACIPDAPTGGGTRATLRLSVDGDERTTIALDSRYAWLYGKGNGQSNDPADGPPHVFWDEFSARIPGGIRAGQTLRLWIAAGDAGDYVRIDCLDLEAVAPPTQRPADALSALDYGAVPDDDGDDTAALQACADAAAEAGVEAWLPPGRYLQQERIRLTGTVLRGAGPWYTELVGTTLGGGWTGTLGVTFSGVGAGVCGLSITSSAHTSRRDGGAKPVTTSGGAHRWLVEDVHLSHTNVGLWMSRAHDGVVRRCRVTGTYADGININKSSSGNLVEHCFVRGCGDDGIALLSETGPDDTPAARNVARHNTISAIYWGHNLDLAGGNEQVMEDNLAQDGVGSGVFTINLPGAYPMFPAVDPVVRRNTFLRGGGNHSQQRRGAVWIYAGSTAIEGLDFRHNQIIDSLFSAIHLTGGGAQRLALVDNLVVAPADQVLRVDPSVTGSAELRGTVLRDPPPDQALITGADRDGFELHSAGNSWD